MFDNVRNFAQRDIDRTRRNLRVLMQSRSVTRWFYLCYLLSLAIREAQLRREER